jgi:hypothetical protein
MARNKPTKDLTPEQLEKRRKYNREWHRKNAPEMRKRAREWAIKNRDRHNVNQNRAYHRTVRFKRLSKQYGLTKEEYERLQAVDACQICGRKFSDPVGSKSHGRRYIDHCHTSGVVRGVLCRDCNLSEGLLKTSETARKLYEYMLRNEGKLNGSDLV